jgi:hypothetical protein
VSCVAREDNRSWYENLKVRNYLEHLGVDKERIEANFKYKVRKLVKYLYACENCSFMSREENRLKVFENRVLRKIFGGSGKRLARVA